MTRLGLFVLSLAFGWQSVSAVPKRSRAESVPGMEASNTVALGDIWFEAGLSSQFQTRLVSEEFLAGAVDSTYRRDFIGLTRGESRLHRQVAMLPNFSAMVGLGHFLHFEANSIPWDGDKIGASSALLKITTPGNDNLRVFGLGAAIGAVFSTEENVIARHETTPGFDPVLFGAVMIDFDFIKIAPAYPFKVYFNYSNIDESRLVHAYRQHSVKAAIERKGYAKSYYLRGNFGLFKPLEGSAAALDWSGGYRSTIDLGLGFRKGMGDRFSLAAEASFDPYRPLSFYRNEFSKPPRILFEVTVPFLHKESRTEAMRALLFHEHMRRNLRERSAAAASADSSEVPGREEPWERLMKGADTDAESKSAFKELFGNEEELKEKRRKIRTELKDIEELLE